MSLIGRWCLLCLMFRAVFVLNELTSILDSRWILTLIKLYLGFNGEMKKGLKIILL